jgi:hypothetical protein
MAPETVGPYKTGRYLRELARVMMDGEHSPSTVFDWTVHL